MKKVLVCGSIALDLIGRYPGSFAEYQDRYHVEALNISLQLSTLHTSFGGCGMNIAYGLKKLAVDCIPLSAAGRNFTDHYREHLIGLGIDIDNIVIDEDFEECATAILINDNAGNHITAFHAGASVSAKRRLPREVDSIEEVALAVLAPEDAPIMLRQARDLRDLDIKVMFDPGQGLAEFSREEAVELLELSTYVVLNAHEWDILQRVARLTPDEIIEMTEQVIVTRGDQGVLIYEGRQPVTVPALHPDRVVDTIGCGDAFRAGYVAGLIERRPADHCGRLGCLTALYNLESPQTQRYDFDIDAFGRRFEEAYGYPIG